MARELISKNLTELEQNIVMNYVLDFNVTYTAKRTGVSKWKVTSTIKKPEAEQSIDAIKLKVAEKCDVTLEQTLNELKRIAFYDPKDHILRMNEHGIEFKDMDDIDGRAIAEITTQSTSDGNVYTTMKTHSKLKALELLMAYFNKAEGDKHVHFHVSSEELKSKTASESADSYNNLLNI